MSDPTLPNAPAENIAVERDPDLDLEVWKHFAAMGGIDKNTMITTVSWLLIFSASAIGYLVTESPLIADSFPKVERPGITIAVSALGMFVSAVACYLAVLYAGYSNRNWAKADQIAERQQWLDLLPKEPADGMKREKAVKPTALAAFAWRRARPCYPETQLAPVFTIFLFLALLSGLLHGAFLTCGVISKLT